MTCKEIEISFLDYLDDQLPLEEFLAFEEHFKDCPECREEFNKYTLLYKQMASVPKETASYRLRTSFEEMLENEKFLLKNDKSSSKYKNWRTAFQVAASLLLALLGYIYGEHRGELQANEKIAYLQAQSKILQTEMMLVMMDNISASKRIKAIGYLEELDTSDAKILMAIIGRFKNDQNINVRLAAAEALSRYLREPMVIEAYIQALSKEKNPDIQIAIIQHLIDIREEQSLEPIKKLLEEPEVPDYVKSMAHEGLIELL